MKENTFDLQKECGFVPWTEEQKSRIERWINAVVNMQDPSVTTVNEAIEAGKEIVGNPAPSSEKARLDDPNDPFNQALNDQNDDLPF